MRVLLLNILHKKHERKVIAKAMLILTRMCFDGLSQSASSEITACILETNSLFLAIGNPAR